MSGTDRELGVPDLVGDFAGHVERAHFVVLADPARADELGESITAALDRVLPLYYDHDDRERASRAGESGVALAAGELPLMSPRVVALIDRGGRFGEPEDVMKAARASAARAKLAGAARYSRDE